ncbi:hypothetical protein MMC30_008258 [Trapelia coarctata]|nr:hypothetical protein [Trapelia coarctata]
MPPKRALNANKRKAVTTSSPPPSNGEPAPKKAKPSSNPDIPDAEKYSIVDRRFYPPEMSNARCQQYTTGALPRPLAVLEKALADTKQAREAIPVKDAVVHWFKCDLRTQDNRALHLASAKSKSKGVPLICVYIVSPEDFEAHMTAPVRVDFLLRTLETLKSELAALDIPLYVETVDARADIPSRIFTLCEQWGASHLFANMEYEVDELRREARIVRTGLQKGVSVEVVHDTCVVAPGALASQQGRQYAVYTPWFRAWLAYLRLHPKGLDLFPAPVKNPASARDQFSSLFATPVPEAPGNKRLTGEERTRFQALWPPGEAEARSRLKKFLGERVHGYKDKRNFPAEAGTAVLSVHFAAGTLSARTAVQEAREANKGKLEGGSEGVATWVSEVAWRDFYKHVLAGWPFVW